MNEQEIDELLSELDNVHIYELNNFSVKSMEEYDKEFSDMESNNDLN